MTRAQATSLLAKVELTDHSGLLHVTLLEKSSPVSINKQLVRDGWLRVLQRPEWKLKAYVSTALHAHTRTNTLVHLDRGNVCCFNRQESVLTRSRSLFCLSADA